MRSISKPTAIIIACLIVAFFALAACTGNNNPINPTPTLAPVPSISETTANPDPTTAAPKTVPPAETEAPATNKPEPSSSPTSDAAAPPATQFAQRWGQRYPTVPEFAILKAANATCAVIAEVGSGWETNPVALLAFEKAVEAAGLSGNDGVEFAQDANQNYCSSVSNPT